ncbi:hypothetical protein OQA88_10533 [Cercophora sp. LCS_1]
MPDEPPPPFAPEAANPVQPPAYHEQRDDPNEIVQPVTYALHGRFVYGLPNTSSPLYELSRVIHAQGDATTSIEFQRLDYRVRTQSDGTPRVAHRGKHLYNLIHLPDAWVMDYQFSLQSITRKTLGNVIMKKSPFPHSGFRVYKQLTDEEIEREKKRGNKPKHDFYFVIKDKKNTWEWCDGQGNVVATQVSTMGSDGLPEHNLLVLVPLTRRMMDALVALWCLWLWNIHASGAKEKRGWKDFKRIMEQPHPDFVMK